MRGAAPPRASCPLRLLMTAATSPPAAEYVPLDKLIPWAANPRPIKPRDVRDVARSIKRFGFGEPVLARKANNEIIAGHLRVVAARKVGLASVPVRFMDLSETEAHALALADNKLQANRGTDKDAMRAALEALEAAGTDLEKGTGFTEAELDKFIGSNFVTSEVGLEELTSVPEFWLSVRGPLTIQPEVLALLRDALNGCEGVIVNLGMTGSGK